MTSQEKWDRRFLALAKEVSTWSKDPSTKCGAIMIKNRRIVGTGYNGFPVGVRDDEERYANRDLKYKMIVHAEVNACVDAGRDAVGATLYVYPSFMIPPICNECAKVAIQSGVACVVGFKPDKAHAIRAKRWEESILVSKHMFGEAGINWRSYDE